MLCCRTFLRELELYTDCPELVGRCFLERVSEIKNDLNALRSNIFFYHTHFIQFFFFLFPQMTDLQIYEKYCHNKPRSESLWRQCSDCAFFQVNLTSSCCTNQYHS